MVFVRSAIGLTASLIFLRMEGGASLLRTDRPALHAAGDLWIFAVLGLMSALIGYSLSQAYRLGTAAVVASYEYVALPLAIFWGWMVFGEVPAPIVWVGIALIAGAGLAVFTRERYLARPVASARPMRRG